MQVKKVKTGGRKKGSIAERSRALYLLRSDHGRGPKFKSRQWQTKLKSYCLLQHLVFPFENDCSRCSVGQGQYKDSVSIVQRLLFRTVNCSM